MFRSHSNRERGTYSGCEIQRYRTQQRALCLRLDSEVIRECSFYKFSILNSVQSLKWLPPGFFLHLSAESFGSRDLMSVLKFAL